MSCRHQPASVILTNGEQVTIYYVSPKKRALMNDVLSYKFWFEEGCYI